MDILKYYEKAIEFVANTAVAITAKHKGLSASGYLITGIIIFCAVMMSPSITSLAAVGILSVLLFALRSVVEAESKRGARLK